MRRIWTTIELISGQRAAIIESHDTDGVWCGSARIEVRFPYRLHPSAPTKDTQDREALYELGYQRAKANADAHGGTLDRFGWA